MAKLRLGRQRDGSRVFAEINIEPRYREQKDYDDPRKKVFGKTFSMSGKVIEKRKTFASSSGQVFDDVKIIKPGDIKVKDSRALISIWKRWHLNDLKAGTRKQEEELKKVGMTGATKYDKAVKHLKKKGLYVDRGYKYGTAWLHERLPKSVERRVITIVDQKRRRR